MLNKKHCLALTDSSAAQEESDSCYRRNICSVKCSVKKKNHTGSENEESNKGESACQKVVDRTKSENGLQDECLNSMHHPGMYLHVLKEFRIGILKGLQSFLLSGISR
jgi:sentrin-specific protease 6